MLLAEKEEVSKTDGDIADQDQFAVGCGQDNAQFVEVEDYAQEFTDEPRNRVQNTP